MRDGARAGSHDRSSSCALRRRSDTGKRRSLLRCTQVRNCGALTIQQLDDCGQSALRAPASTFHDMKSSRAKLGSLMRLLQQTKNGGAELFRVHYEHGIGGEKGPHDLAKVLIVRADENRLRELCRFEDVVAAAWNERSANKGNLGDRVHRRQLADGIE